MDRSRIRKEKVADQNYPDTYGPGLTLSLDIDNADQEVPLAYSNHHGTRAIISCSTTEYGKLTRKFLVRYIF